MNAIDVLHDLKARGFVIVAHHGQLHVHSESARITPSVQALLAEHKPEIVEYLGRIARPCCSLCMERVARPDPLEEGCRAHRVRGEQVGAWWQAAAAGGATVSVCLCCFGPSPAGAQCCRRCEAG
jgi:hypothetical protein